MDRRDFIKLSALTAGAAGLAGCGHPDHQLIRFLPEESWIPGVATWRPSLCPLCAAGCGVMARVMEGDAEVVRNGRTGLLRMGLVKKLEGNPAHPVNRGKLCARGQAAVQIVYHPDRIRQPLKRRGERGTGEFEPVDWDEALSTLAARLKQVLDDDPAGLAWLSRPLRGGKRVLVERFLATLAAPAPVYFELFDESVLRWANRLSFGREQMPTYTLSVANYVLGLSADFLGTWNSPVAQAIGYGEFRQGRPGRRGKFVQVEPRVSQTGANADEWIPIRPGTEGALALGLAHVLLNEARRPTTAAGTAGERIEGWLQGLPEWTPEAVAEQTGIEAERIRRLARELIAHEPAVVIAGGAALAQTNGLATALAVNALNALLGCVGALGPVRFTPQPESTGLAPPHRTLRALVQKILSRPESPVKLLLLYEANPVFATPPAWQVAAALDRVPFVVSFGSFLDDTSILADLVLPDHVFLESWMDDVPESGTEPAVVSLAAPAMRPLHNTRAMPDVLLDLSRRVGGRLNEALPWKSYEELLRARFDALARRAGADADAFWKQALERGGWWSDNGGTRAAAPRHAAATTRQIRYQPAEMDGSVEEFPFHFLPYASQAFYDGTTAHLPWLQELPDVLTTAMWGSWVELNPQTAERLGIRQGDLVDVTSRHGTLQAPVILSTGIAPDVVAMPVGQGHRAFTRYASRRGANPISVLAPLEEPETGALAWAATRVQIRRAGVGRLVLFSGGLSRFPHPEER
ncbi:MAG: molybdopterin-dependent oxidoreductase [Firmicutes bacterium]|nr:molybdopterin-dependent oxidoreductase [Bacillota bacterium]